MLTVNDFSQSSKTKFWPILKISLPILLAAALLALAGVTAARAGFQPAQIAAAPAAPAYQAVTPAPPLAGSAPITGTPEITVTVTTTPTLTPTATEEPTPTATSEPLPSQSLAYVPLILHKVAVEPVATTPVLFCSSLSPALDVPDNDSTGLAHTIFVNDSRRIGDLDIGLNISHSFVGDLKVRLTHQESGLSLTLIDRPGVPSTELGCNGDNIISILDDDVTLPAHKQCNDTAPAIGGLYTPTEPLSIFDGQEIAGSWTLEVSDLSALNTGKLRTWCISAQVSPSPPPPTPPPSFPNLPEEAQITNISGVNQALPLDCESRSAVDWARYFGFNIGELEFFHKLPVSDNPDAGFVGDVMGAWGQTPPKPYGVHAEPVAALLRSYGVPAYAHRPLSWDALRAEIAAGRPVYTWVIGSVYNGIPNYYTALDGHITIVAPREHTVLVIGYTPNSVTILDGSKIYTRTRNQFLRSWSVLQNMAITATP